jgi:protein TonB
MTNTFVTGSASTYAGGTTTPTGTGTSAAHGGPPLPPPPPRPAPRQPPPPSPAPDRSRPPGVAGGLQWSCPFPPEADADQIDGAVVGIRADVDASGQVKNVAIVSDPGHGFGRAARRCALARTWIAALNRDGAATDGSVVVNVRFAR